MFRSLIAGIIMTAATGMAVTNTLGSIRVYAIEPACFDFVFTSIVASSATNPVLSFNHRGGRTYFVRVGDSLGDYVVSNFQSLSTNIFNPTIKLHQERKDGRVTLTSANGPAVILDMGKRLPQPGWMAYLVDLADGNWWYVKEGDVIESRSVSLRLGAIGSNSVAILTAGTTNGVSLISEAESKTLLSLWTSRVRRQGAGQREEEAREEADALAYQVDLPAPDPVRHEAPFAAPSRSLTIRYPSRTFFGTEYPCPTDYLVLPAIWSASGHIIRPTIVIPRRFEMRSSGFTMEYR